MKSELRLPFYLAWQYIRRGRKWTFFLTTSLMAVAFINLIFISSLFNGIIDGSNKQIINTLTGNIYLTPKDGDDFIKDKNKVLDTLKSVNGVEAASAEMLVPAELKYKNLKGNWQILAINPADESKVTNVGQKIIEGSYLNVNDEDAIIIGRQITGGSDDGGGASSFKGAKIGEKVTLAIDGVSKDFTIKGIFETKFSETDKRAFITEKALGQLMPGADTQATTIVVKISAGQKEQDIISKIHAIGIEANVYSWQEAAGLMKSISESFLSINILMSTVGILIAGVTIFIVIYVDIINKKKQIGILRAIGIKPYIIITSYVILSAVYSVLGVILGTAIFLLVLTPYFQAHPFVLPIADAVLVLDKADYIARSEAIMWVSVLSGLIPAAIITRTKMLDAILGR